MSDKILYYSFSTVPQVLAAIIALTGFFWLFYRDYYTAHMWKVFNKKVGKSFREAYSLIFHYRVHLSGDLREQFDESSIKYERALEINDLPRLFHAIENLRTILKDVRSEFMDNLPILKEKRSRKVLPLNNFIKKSDDFLLKFKHMRNITRLTMWGLILAAITILTSLVLLSLSDVISLYSLREISVLFILILTLISIWINISVIIRALRIYRVGYRTGIKINQGHAPKVKNLIRLYLKKIKKTSPKGGQIQNKMKRH